MDSKDKPPSEPREQAPEVPAWQTETREADPNVNRPAPPPLPNLPSFFAGKYKVLGRLGAGGMGEVFRVRHEGLGKEFALKRISAASATDKESRARFELEARALGRLDHPNILKVTDFGFDETGNGSLYLVTEVLNGESLAARIWRHGRLPVDEALAVLGAVARALDYANSKDILHRDLKPDNIFLAKGNGSSDQVKLLDFGLAKFVKPQDPVIRPRGKAMPEAPAASVAQPGPGMEIFLPGGQVLTHPRDILGTRGFIAPELWRGGSPSRASEVFAFGVTAYLALTGKMPFPVPPGEEAHSSPVPPSEACSELPSDFDGPLLRSLSLDPGGRPASAGEVVRELVQARDTAARRSWRKREYPRRARLAAVLGLSLGLAGAFLQGSGLMDWIENKSFDARVWFSKPRQPDPRITVLLIDDASDDAGWGHLANPDVKDRLAGLLRRLLESGISGVALDMVFDEAYNDRKGSDAFQSLLRDYGGDVDAPPPLILGALGERGSKCVDKETRDALLNGNCWNSLFAYVDFQRKGDDLIRRMRIAHPGASTEDLRKTMAAAVAAFLLGPKISVDKRTYWVDDRISAQAIDQHSWIDLPNLLEKTDYFKGRAVIVGVSFSGNDMVRIPQPGELTGAKIPGAVAVALMANTILNGYPLKQTGAWTGGAFLALFCFAMLFWTLVASRLEPVFVTWAALALLYPLLGFFLFDHEGVILPFAVPLMGACTALALALVIRKKMSPSPGSAVRVSEIA